MNGWIYIITNTAVFSFYIVLLIFFLLFFITQPWKKDDTKTLRPLRSLVRIFTARADAHNTNAPLPTFKLRLQKINNPVWKKTCPFISRLFNVPSFLWPTNDNNIYNQTNNRQKTIFTTDEHAGLQDEPNIYFFMSLLLHTKATIIIFIIKIISIIF